MFTKSLLMVTRCCKRISSCIICFFFLLIVPLTGISQQVSFADSIAVIESQSRPEQVIKEIDLSGIQFTSDADKRKNFGVVGSRYYYILLKLVAPRAIPSHYLSIDNTSIDTVSIYEVDYNKTGRIVYQGGQLIPFNVENKYVWHTVPVEINNEPSFYLVSLKASQKNINVKYELLNEDELQQKYQDHDRMIFFYIGIISLTIAITILAFLVFKKNVFLFYLGYVVFAAIWILSHYGYVFSYVYPQVPIINEIIKPFSSLSSAFFILLVLNEVFEQPLQSRNWLRSIVHSFLYGLPLLVALMLLLLLPNLHYGIKNFLLDAWHAALIVTLGIVVFIPLRVFNSGAIAKIFSVAMIVICGMTAIQLIANLGGLSNYFIEEHGVAMASAVENGIIAFGLFYNLLLERKQRAIQVLALEQEQAETLKKLITVQDNERKRIAADLHDNIGPLLAALKINFRRIINTKERTRLNGLASKTESIIDDSIAEIRNVAHNLMPKGLSSNGLISTLQEYFDSLQQLYDKTITFYHKIEPVLNHEMQINLYRIICELVLNSARHSAASCITVAINANQELISLNISDDGKGFQMKTGANMKSFGLQNVEGRVLILKGTFRLKTETGKGTKIEIDIPLQFDDIHVNRL